MAKSKAEWLKKHHFKPGQSGNPDGGKKHNRAIRTLKQLTLEQYCNLIEVVALESGTKVKNFAKDENCQNLLGTLSRCWMIAKSRGDYETIEKILSRVLGKIPDEFKISSQNINANVSTVIDNVRMKAAIAALEEDV